MFAFVEEEEGVGSISGSVEDVGVGGKASVGGLFGIGATGMEPGRAVGIGVREFVRKEQSVEGDSVVDSTMLSPVRSEGEIEDGEASGSIASASASTFAAVAADAARLGEIAEKERKAATKRRKKRDGVGRKGRRVRSTGGKVSVAEGTGQNTFVTGQEWAVDRTDRMDEAIREQSRLESLDHTIATLVHRLRILVAQNDTLVSSLAPHSATLSKQGKTVARVGPSIREMCGTAVSLGKAGAGGVQSAPLAPPGLLREEKRGGEGGVGGVGGDVDGGGGDLGFRLHLDGAGLGDCLALEARAAAFGVWKKIAAGALPVLEQQVSVAMAQAAELRRETARLVEQAGGARVLAWEGVGVEESEAAAAAAAERAALAATRVREVQEEAEKQKRDHARQRKQVEARRKRLHDLLAQIAASKPPGTHSDALDRVEAVLKAEGLA